VLGGLVVILRIPHSDERQSSPAGKPAQKR
jgi:hypothetical protein